MDIYYIKYLKYKSKYIKAKQILEAGAASSTGTASSGAAATGAAAKKRDYIDELFDRNELFQFAKSNRETFLNFIKFMNGFHKKYKPDFFFRSERISEGKQDYPFGNDPNIYETDILYVFKEMVSKKREFTFQNFEDTLFKLYDEKGHMGL